MAGGFRSEGLNPPEMTLGQKLAAVNWLMVLVLCAIASVGFAMLYSAANGSFTPWASRQAVRFAVGLAIMLTVAMIDVRFWMRSAYLIYGVVLALLFGVEVMGEIGMGAQRWIDLGIVQLQPSELMKISIVLVLARYFHGLTWDEVGNPLNLIPPLLLIGMPVVLVMRQPDLGTALMILMGAGATFFLAGVRVWKFLTVIGIAVATVPIAWQMMRGYQQQRVLTFLNPESDPLGAGYHITQSKIALGSGGMFGKGFLQGSQSHLNFLPEKQTDFIFTMLAEELGMVGGLALISLYVLLIACGFATAMRARNQFGRLVALGITTTVFLYLFINVAMVMGLIPVVGVPLPLISYGGTAMLTLMLGLGLVQGVAVHREVRISRAGVEED